MSRRVEQARQLLESDLLEDLIEDYQQQQYQAFLNAPDLEELAKVFAKANAGRDIGHYIHNKARAIVDGQ